MKQLKFIFASALVAAVLVFAACKNDDKDKDEPVNPSTEVSVDPNPSADQYPYYESDCPEGYIRLFAYVPNGVCEEGFVFRGPLYDGDAWDMFTPFTPVSEIAEIKNNNLPNWYVAVIKMKGGVEAEGETDLQYSGKACQLKDGTVDGSWTTQWAEWSIIEFGNYAENEVHNTNGNLQILDQQLESYIRIDSWQDVPCEVKTYHTYNVTFKVPAMCQPFDIEVVGGFEEGGWGSAPVALTLAGENTYTATFEAWEGCQFKLREAGTWDNEIIQLTVMGDDNNPKGADNVVCGSEVEIVVDYSDVTLFGWKACQ
ncbi:MAG: hypothetical protein IJU35_02280 [Paludibacteraceae bacterium]|nr:hypothetical protein [Paludibacteraceae bacterium]